MAAGACEIVDEREDYDQLVPGREIVVFHDGDDLLSKIEYYIQHEQERRQIGEAGHRMAQRQYSMKYSLNQILAESR